jgi:hypothetical protein
MTNRDAFLDSLSSLKDFIIADSPERAIILQKAMSANPWFIPEFSIQAIDAIASEYLDADKCSSWMNSYPLNASAGKRVALIMAGNVPMVGFHDLFCVLASGHAALVKLSDKDSILLPWIIEAWININPSLSANIIFTDRLLAFDAAIATGSNNSSRYFEYYFRDYPHILRQHRNGIAVLTGEETAEDLKSLAKDIFLFFGLGCRNVSKVFVPEGFDFEPWKEAMREWAYLGDHNKYKNNLDYNFAIYIINRVPHIQLGHLILKEDDAFTSRIGCVHYSYYKDMDGLTNDLSFKKDEIQCVISQVPVRGWEHISFGESQWPRLDQYADGVDTMKFLTSL